MKQKFWQTEKFKELEKEWYQRLAEEKFPDVEKPMGEWGVLKQRASNCYRNNHQTEIENKRRFYELMAQGVHDELEFRDNVEKFVMERRAAGAKIKEICAELKQVNERCHRDTVENIIKKYVGKWQLKRRQREST